MYSKIDDMPLHVFTNKECTITPNPELRQYLEFMVESHPDDLEYIWRYCQQYTKHGGCYVITFDRWIAKLKTDLAKQRRENE